MQPKTSAQTNGQPDKVIRYSPPEIGKTVSVSFYLHQPHFIVSPTLEKKKSALLVVDGSLDKAKTDYVVFLLKKQLDNIHILNIGYGPKNLARVKQIWTSMLKVHPDVAVALGGGTTCDLVGFASSCYHRGLDCILFPTTLLSMVDACIGGKTGIDFGGVKNSIGQVHYAVESHCIFPFLDSLNQEELISGFSEVIKAAMLFDENLLQSIEKLEGSFNLGQDWFSVVSRGAELKAQFSEQPFSQRSKLLYGHNIGHGLETLSSIHRRHGDCVAVGMSYELAIGVVSGLVKREVWERQNKILKKFKLPTQLPANASFAKMKEKMRKYKLYKDDAYLFVIPERPGVIIEDGSGYYCRLSEKQLDTTFKEVNKLLI